MGGHGRQEQVPITRPLVVDFVVRDDLVLRFLHLHQLAKLVRLAGFALAYDLVVGLEQADQFPGKLSYAGKYSRLSLPHHSVYLARSSMPVVPLARAQHGAGGRGGLRLPATPGGNRSESAGSSAAVGDILVCASVRLPLPCSATSARWDHPLDHTAHAAADFSFQTAHFMLDLFHGSRQHASAIVQ